MVVNFRRLAVGASQCASAPDNTDFIFIKAWYSLWATHQIPPTSHECMAAVLLAAAEHGLVPHRRTLCNGTCVGGGGGGCHDAHTAQTSLTYAACRLHIDIRPTV